MEDSRYLERFYLLHSWPANPYTEEGRSRYKLAVQRFSGLVSHPFIEGLPSRVRLLDILSGEGIGGVALAKVLGSTRSVDLIMMDLRKKALEIAKKFSKEELGYEARTISKNVLQVHEVIESRSIDLALMYGLSTPHFNPWDAAIMLASLSRSMKDEGVLVVEEIDRRYNVFYLKGYERIIPMIKEDEVVLDFHRGYDFKTGMFKRSLVSLKTGEIVNFEVYFWGVAEFLAIMWLFFEEVDLYSIGDRAYFLMARKPRRKINPSDLEIPMFLR